MKYIDEARSQIMTGFKGNNCCLYAFLSALVSTNINQFDGHILELRFIDNSSYLFLKESLAKIYGERINCTDGDFSGRKFVLIDGDAIAELMDNLAIALLKDGVVVEDRIVENDCCRLSFCKGLLVGGAKFFASQDLNDKSTGYNLEISFDSEKTCEMANKLFSQYGFTFKKGNHLGKQILYLRDSEQIADLFLSLGAVKASLSFQNDLSLRTMKNNLNRQNNCYDANQTKTINASFEQIRAIEGLKKSGEFDLLDEDSKLIATIRLDNPDSSLSELCKLYPHNITRAGMKYKLDRFIKMNQKRKR